MLAVTPDHAGGVNYRGGVRGKPLQRGGIVQVTLYEGGTQVGQMLCFVRIADQYPYLESLLQ